MKVLYAFAATSQEHEVIEDSYYYNGTKWEKFDLILFILFYNGYAYTVCTQAKYSAFYG